MRVDYLKLLEQDLTLKNTIYEIVFKTIVADNPEFVQLIYTMLQAGINEDQIVTVIKSQMRIHK